MKTAKRKTDRENTAAFDAEQEGVQQQGAVLSIVKEDAAQGTEQEQAEQAQPVQQQPEQEAAAPEVQPLTVEQKLLALQDLGRIATQRGNLISMMEALKRFEIKQVEHAELDESNLYKTCELIIKDEKGIEFCTKNTVLITATVANLLNKSENRLAELESLLVFPAA